MGIQDKDGEQSTRVSCAQAYESASCSHFDRLNVLRQYLSMVREDHLTDKPRSLRLESILTIRGRPVLDVSVESNLSTIDFNVYSSKQRISAPILLICSSTCGLETGVCSNMVRYRTPDPSMTNLILAPDDLEIFDEIRTR